MKKPITLAWGLAVILLPALLVLHSCSNKSTPHPAPQLPAITMTGANSFGGVIDEQLWVPRQYSAAGASTMCINYTGNTLDFAIFCDREDDDSNTGNNQFIFHRSGITGPGTYDLTDPSKTSIEVISEDLDLSSDTYIVTSGTLTITKLDLTNHIVSGQFDCVVKNATEDVTHTVTGARFDLKIGYCQ